MSKQVSAMHARYSGFSLIIAGCVAASLAACSGNSTRAAGEHPFPPARGGANDTISLPGGASFGGGNNDLNVDLGASLSRRKTAGGLSAFSTAASTLPARASGAFASYNHAVFFSGGNANVSGSLTAQSDVYVAQVLQSGALSAWTATNSMLAPRAYHQSLAYNGYLYVVGGFTSNPTAAVTDIQFAPIDSAGATVGTWTSTGQGIPANAQFPFAANNVLYLVGNNNAGDPFISSAAVNVNGTLGAFSTRLAFPISVLTPAIAIGPKALYVVGGQQPGSNTPMQNAQIGLFDSNGVLNRWVAGPMLPVARTSAVAVIDGGFLYLLGGYDGGLAPSSYAAPILPSGLLGPWISVPGTQNCGPQGYVVGGSFYIPNVVSGSGFCKATPQLATTPIGGTNDFVAGPTLQSARGDLALASNPGTLAIIGGRTATAAVSDIYTVSIDPIGRLGVMTANPASLPGPRSGHAAVAVQDHLLVIAGQDNAANPLNDIQIASFKPGVGPSTFTTSSVALPGGRAYPAAVATSSMLYVTGGATASGPINEVQMASISAGSAILGSFSPATNVFTTARSKHASVLYNNRLYVIGGDSGTGKLGDIQYAALDSNGAPGTWSTAPNALATPRSGHAAFAANGVLYVVGGVGASGELGDVQMAALDVSGNPGVWTPAGNPLTTARHGFGGVLANGQMLLAGGFNGTTPLGDLPTTISNAPAAVGIYSRVFELGGEPDYPINLLLDGTAANNGAISFDSSVGISGPIGLGVTTPLNAGGRKLWLKLTLDDTFSAVLAGGGERDVTSLTLNYTVAAPPTTLAFTGTPQTVAFGACSMAVYVGPKNSGGFTTVATSATVTLSGTSGVSFYSDALCTNGSTSVQIVNPSASSDAIYFKSTTSGAVTLTATTPGLTAGTQAETIQPANGGATKLVFSGLAVSYHLGDTLNFTVSLQDASGNVIPSVTNQIQISLGHNPQGGTLGGTTSMTTSSGTAVFALTLDKAATGYQLLATGTPPLTDGPASSASFDVNAGQIAFNSNPLTFAQGSCGGPLLVVFKSLTSQNIIAAPSVIAVALAPVAGVTFYQDSACTAALAGTLSVSPGSLSTSLYLVDTLSGTGTVTVAASGYGSAVQGFTVTAPGGGNPDGGGGDTPDGGAAIENIDHRTINGFACSSGGSGGSGFLLVALLAAFGLSRRRAGFRRLAPAMIVAALPVRGLRRLSSVALLVLATALPAFAAETPAETPAEPPANAPLVAVLNFRNKLLGDDKDKAGFDSDYLTNTVRAQALNAVDGIRVITTENMLALISATGKTLAECEGECEVDTARSIGADLVVSGELLKFGAYYRLVLRLHDTHSKLLLKGVEAHGKNADDLGAELSSAVTELFAPLAAKREAEKREAQKREDAKREAEQRKILDAKAETDRQAEQTRDRALQEERKRDELQRLEQETRIQAQVSGPRFGIYGGLAVDPKAKTFGEEAGLALRLGAGWTGSVGAVIGPHIGGRAIVYARLAGETDLSLSFGLRFLVEPLPDGLAIGGGPGLRVALSPVPWLSVYSWLAAEVYKTTGETIFAPLLQLGLQINL